MNRMYQITAAAVLAALILNISGCGAAEVQPSAQDGYAGSTASASAANAGISVKAQTLTTQMNEINDKKSLSVQDDKYRTTYEVFLYSYYDSNGDGIGDIKGLIQKLDYINDGNDQTGDDLGCNEIWLMPVCPSPTYHKYDVTDYESIDPQYGTLDDFRQLAAKCHQRGIRLITDMVMNHTSSEHPWFKQAVSYLQKLPEGQEPSEKDCPYVKYYNFSRKKSEGYEPLKGTGWYYEARFWSGMPDLNLDNPAVRKEFQKIAEFWLTEGADGFRMDAVTSYYTGQNAKNIETLKWYTDMVKKIDSDAYVVGEAWTDQGTYASYYKSGIDSLFDFAFSGSTGIIANTIKKSIPAKSYAEAMVREQELYGSYNKDYVNAPFYTNHDMARSAGYYAGDDAQSKVKLAGALNLLMNGNAFIYYGEELGMKGSGKDENKRAPMYWSEDAAGTGMCKGPANMDAIKMLYGSYEEQKKDPLSVYQYYRQAIRLRNIYPVIARGKVQMLNDISGKDICAFIKIPQKQGDGDGIPLLIVINTSAESRTVDLSGQKEYDVLGGVLTVSQEKVTQKENRLIMPAYAIAILTKQADMK